LVFRASNILVADLDLVIAMQLFNLLWNILIFTQHVVDENLFYCDVVKNLINSVFFFLLGFFPTITHPI